MKINLMLLNLSIHNTYFIQIFFHLHLNFAKIRKERIYYYCKGCFNIIHCS